MIELSDNIYYIYTTHQEKINILCLYLNHQIYINHSEVFILNDGCSIEIITDNNRTNEHSKLTLIELNSTNLLKQKTSEKTSKHNITFSILSILILTAWISIIYFLHKCNSKTFQLNQIQSSSPDTQKLNLKCEFAFNNNPPIVNSFQSYDVPTSTRTIMDDELDAINANKNVKYTSIIKKKVTFNENINTSHEI